MRKIIFFVVLVLLIISIIAILGVVGVLDPLGSAEEIGFKNQSYGIENLVNCNE